MSESDQDKSYIKVYVRHRPFIKNEIDFKVPSIIKSMNEQQMVVKSGLLEKSYRFDGVFDDTTTQAEIYDTVVNPLIEYVVSGYNCTVFAYGQTGTGKTHTMIGAEVVEAPVDVTNDPSVGIMPRAARHLFEYLNKLGKNVDYTVNLSFLEIYNEDVRDLLITDSPSLRIYDDPENKGSIYVNGLREVTVCDIVEVFNWLHIGTKERQTAATNLNRQSSRSHSLFTLVVHTRETTSEGEEVLKTGKLHMIDLAGSENIGRSGATDMRAREAGTINKSLLTLGKVIKALVQKMQHIPYRDSKLTRILQDSLGGNSKTCMIATFSPGLNNWDETISTLDYAFETRKVANCPKANINRKQILVIKDIKDEIMELRRELDAARRGEGFYITPNAYNSMENTLRVNEEKVLHLVKEIQRLEDYRKMKEEQYKELNGSFEKNKAFLEKTRRALEETTLKDKQDQFVINYMNGREIELVATANHLIDVCERSTEHEHVYHSKYEAQSKSTAENVKIIKELFSCTDTELQALQDHSEEYVHNQDQRFQFLKESFRSFATNQFNNVEDLGALAAEMKSKSADTALNYEAMLEHNNFDYVSTMEKLNAELLKKLRKPLDSYSMICKALDDVKDQYLRNNRNLTAMSMECAAFFEVDKLCEEALFEYLETSYNDVKASLNDYAELWQQRDCMEEQIKATLLNKVPTLEAMQDQLLTINEDTKKWVHNLKCEMKDYEEIAVLETLKEQLTSLKKRHISALEMEAATYETVLGELAKYEARCEQQVEDDKMEAGTQLSGYFNTAENNVTQFNENLKSYFQGCLERVQATKQSMLDGLNEPVDVLEQTFEEINEVAKTHGSDVKQFTQVSAEKIVSMGEGAVQKAHVGDTPVKEALEFPKSIEKRVPDENLLEQFKMNNK